LGLERDGAWLENYRRNCGRFETLTAREREVMALVVNGRLNKQIAYEITVNVHRGQVMRKMNAMFLSDLAQMADGLNFARKKFTPDGPTYRSGLPPLPGSSLHRPSLVATVGAFLDLELS
jgi:DNA-binding CsgD family transcriptional regulator